MANASLLLRSVRLVPIGLGGRGGDPVDLRIVDGRVTQIAPTLGRRSAEQLIDAEGRGGGAADAAAGAGDHGGAVLELHRLGCGGPNCITPSARRA